ncbi:30S ribosomal protein S18 [Kitasatospora paracochleata]|uniref:Small ribosomal subunit protein bS18 n=1 Tax=Kitasatospora paracochleata TaxID=58354 RepID=A0ABT1IWE0_9ACTN|nr:30S ribosomal protein S18 [Kitasatospora paracochleata]MCP2309450.1 small subunit ribosomal protein S18 [Kitasatospora paracochleata]
MAKRPGPARPAKPRPNPLIEAGITYVDYKDTTLPPAFGRGCPHRKFISDRGKIRSRRVTRLTVQQQKAMARAIKNAREMALLPYASRAKADR